MYTFSSKLKTISFALMILGILGIGFGFYSAPKTIEDVKKIMASSENHEGGHEGANHEAVGHENATHGGVNHEEVVPKANGTAIASAHDEAQTSQVVSTEVKADSISSNDSIKIQEAIIAPVAHKMSKAELAAEKIAHDKEHEEHLEHVLHQLQNKPWAAFYVACLFFMLISLGVLAFYAIQQVAQSGWSPVLFRVMQGITAYLPVGSLILFVFLILSGLHLNHLFAWMQEGITDPLNEHYDKIIAGKAGYLNFPFWIARAALFLIGWNLYRYYSRKNCLAQDESNNNDNYKKNFKLSAMFLVFFIVTESIMSWDWIMSVDPHWSSTLFGWYVFASFIVSAVTVISMVTMYLKSKGYLEYVNTSHIHDLSKFMFGFSVFWTYLWFSQYMLIWYSNIPEEVTYFVTRIDKYTLPFFGAVVMNFVFPLLVLVNTDFKRIFPIIAGVGVIILCGHYIDFFNMIMPATVGDHWFIGVSEISSVLFFVGLFIFVVFSALTKAPLLPKRNPFIEESKHFHY